MAEGSSSSPRRDFDAPICVTDDNANSAIDVDLSGTLKIGGGGYVHSDASKSFEVIVIDRAAYNQGKNAAYEPYIAVADVMPPLVARGPHAVAVPTDVIGQVCHV